MTSIYKRVTALPTTVWLVASVLIISAATFYFGLWGSGFHLAPPLDDTFIHMQYARQLATGHAFQYNTGDALSSGESSFIYPFLLAIPYLLGFHDLQPLLFADGLNVLAHTALVLIVFRLATELFGRPVGLLCAVLILLNGRFNWSFLSGMETGLYTTTLAAYFLLWLVSIRSNRFVALSVVGIVLSLLRPEGHILMALTGIATLFYLWRVRKIAPGSIVLLLPFVVGILPYVLNVVFTGNWQFNTAASKSEWYIPYSTLHENLSLTVGRAITAIKDIYLGFAIGNSPFPILALPITLIGVVAAFRDHRFRALHTLLIFAFLVGMAMALLLQPAHYYRYYLPYDSIFLLYLAYGATVLIGLVLRALPLQENSSPQNQVSRRSVGMIVNSSAAIWSGVILTVLCLPQFVAYFFAFSNSTRDIYYQQMTFSTWIKQNTPEDARIGVNDVGAHKYLSDRYVFDLAGLTTNSLRSAAFSGWGTIFDILTRMPVEQRPQYFLIHPNVFLNNSEESIRQGLLQQAYSITIQNPTITAGPTEVLYKIDWDLAKMSPTEPNLLTKTKAPVDALNVGDLADEQRHGYELSGRQPTIAEGRSFVTSASYEESGPGLSESGRRHSGWEEFTVNSVAHEDLTIITRAKLNPDAEQTVILWVNGREVGPWKIHNERGAFWQEYEYTVPASFIDASKTRIHLDSTFDPGGPPFASYRYWFYAP